MADDPLIFDIYDTSRHISGEFLISLALFVLSDGSNFADKREGPKHYARGDSLIEEFNKFVEICVLVSVAIYDDGCGVYFVYEDELDVWTTVGYDSGCSICHLSCWGSDIMEV